MEIISYIIGYTSGQTEGAGEVTIDGNLTCTDDGEGNITITEE